MLTESDLKTPRDPHELFSHCVMLFEKLGETDEGTSDLRLKKGLCKVLVEEVFAASIWGSRVYGVGEGVTIAPQLDSLPRDAIVSTDSEQFPLEITQAHMGESECLRILHFERHGWAPGPYTKMKKSGTKKTGLEVTPGRVSYSMNTAVEQTVKLVREAIENKIKKQYSKETRLVVMFEDFVVKDEPGLEETLLSVVDVVAKEPNFSFSHVYLVGWSQKLFAMYAAES